MKYKTVNMPVVPDQTSVVQIRFGNDRDTYSLVRTEDGTVIVQCHPLSAGMTPPQIENYYQGDMTEIRFVRRETEAAEK